MIILKKILNIIAYPFKFVAAAIKTEHEVNKFAGIMLQPVNRNMLDSFSKMYAMDRLSWDEKPKISKWKYYLNPNYGKIYHECESKYNESDESFRKRIIQHIEENDG